MKRTYFIPCSLLILIFIFSVWNSRNVSTHADLWQHQLQQSIMQASAEDWEAALSSLKQGYTDWTSCQTWLHIVTEHDAIDDAEAMYHRAIAFAETREPSEFRAEVADLISQLRLLAEMERLNIRNIL